MSRSVKPVQPFQKHGLRNSNKRSLLLMEPEVIDIPSSPPPSPCRRRAASRNSKLLKQKEVIPQDVIEIDMDADYADVMFIGEKFDKFGSGYPKEMVSVGSSGHYNEVLELKENSENVKIPTRVEAPPPLYPGFEDQMKAYDSASSFSNSKMPSEPFCSNLVGGSGLQLNANAVGDTSVMYPRQNKSAGSVSKKTRANFSSKTKLSISQYLEASLSKNNFVASSVSNNYGYLNYPQALEVPFTAAPSSGWYQPSFMLPMTSLNDPQGWWQQSHTSAVQPSFPNNISHSVTAQPQKNMTASDDQLLPPSNERRAEIMRRFQEYKQFDIVVGHSDHYYTNNSLHCKRPPKDWVKKIQDEWKILEQDLPDTIYVRAYETRMDLLRAVIIGAEGTPYHDGLFFFDIFFPSDYPRVPPKVHYHSGGLRLNPNLYAEGKVCLSLLNTWSGHKNEKWVPGKSTMLQVLVSIQGLILNTKPYFNEPAYERLSGSSKGEELSLQYNEDVFILSLRTMMYTMARPPKHFEDYVVGHFCSRAHDILVACKAYMSGAQVGCLVKGGIQDVDEGDKSSSKGFKDSLAGYVNMLVRELRRIGAQDCDRFLSSGSQ